MMGEWFRFLPTDTLFLRGAESLDKGSDHRAAAMFPPSTETLSGALRTAYLIEHEIPFHIYNRSDFSESSHISQIGRSNEEPPWSVMGPLIERGSQIFVPAPYTWFAAKKELEAYREGKKGSIQVIQAEYVQSGILYPDKTLWVKGSTDEIESLGGKWVNIESVLNGDPVIPLSAEEVYAVETRTGIALDSRRRTVLESHLFTMNHIRLMPNVSLLFGISTSLNIEKTGVFKLGGEQRFGRYEKIDAVVSNEQEEEGAMYSSLSPIAGIEEEVHEHLVATGKITYRGGWNMRDGFHKPLKGFYPAGTVFSDVSETIQAHCIKMEDRK